MDKDVTRNATKYKYLVVHRKVRVLMKSYLNLSVIYYVLVEHANHISVLEIN